MCSNFQFATWLQLWLKSVIMKGLFERNIETCWSGETYQSTACTIRHIPSDNLAIWGAVNGACSPFLSRANSLRCRTIQDRNCLYWSSLTGIFRWPWVVLKSKSWLYMSSQSPSISSGATGVSVPSTSVVFAALSPASPSPSCSCLCLARICLLVHFLLCHFGPLDGSTTNPMSFRRCTCSGVMSATTDPGSCSNFLKFLRVVRTLYISAQKTKQQKCLASRLSLSSKKYK